MKSTSSITSRSSRRAFTLIEMIGVLAIIAILAVTVIPRVFSTISSARVTNAIGSVNAVKTAATEFASRYGTIPYTNANSRLDDLFFTAGILDSRFNVKVGSQTATPPAAAAWSEASGTWAATGGTSQAYQSRLICLLSNTTNPATAYGANYRLDGSRDLPPRARVVSAVLYNVTAAEARELSARIDGDEHTAADTATADGAGKVSYPAPNGYGLTTAYIYLAHQ